VRHVSFICATPSHSYVRHRLTEWCHSIVWFICATTLTFYNESIYMRDMCVCVSISESYVRHIWIDWLWKLYWLNNTRTFCAGIAHVSISRWLGPLCYRFKGPRWKDTKLIDSTNMWGSMENWETQSVHESCRTCQWVVSHIWTSHITHTNEPRHPYKRVMSHMNETCQTCHPYERGHVTHMSE